MPYNAASSRYEKPFYQRSGQSGLLLPRISLGLWQNFGDVDVYSRGLEIVLHAFDHGITHFDLANNYGPSPGSAEINFGKMLRDALKPYRDELIISTKAGYPMWPGPYGEWGSRKSLLASLDQSLKRMGLEYVDIFYSHRPDPDTPLEETMAALAQSVRQGKALYVGLSNYSPEQTLRASILLKEMGTPCLIHQPSYNIFNRQIEKGLTAVLAKESLGCIAFSSLAQGQLTSRYLKEIPSDSRAAKERFLKPDQVQKNLDRVSALNNLAIQRGQSLAQMAIAWVLRLPVMTSALTGASSVAQLQDNLQALNSLEFSAEELEAIDQISPL